MVKRRNRNIRSKLKTYTATWLLVATAVLALSGCATNMALEEAKKVSIALDQTSIAKPSRRITDILAVLDQQGRFDSVIREKLQTDSDTLPPAEGDDETMAQFYRGRGGAARNRGQASLAIDDLRRAMIHAEKSGQYDPNLLRSLDNAERQAGNSKRAVELLQKALALEPAITTSKISTYKNLIRAYLDMGDIAQAERLRDECYRAYGNTFVKPVDNSIATSRQLEIDGITETILRAQGRYAEEEQYLRKSRILLQEVLKHALSGFHPGWLRDFVYSMPRHLIGNRNFLVKNLVNQRRFIEAEIEAREAIREAIGLGTRESVLTAQAVETLAKVMLAQGRLEEAEQLVRAGTRILESSGLGAQFNPIRSARMSLGDILSQREDHPAAMEQFTLARGGTYEDGDRQGKKFISNNMILTLLQTGRTDEGWRSSSWPARQRSVNRSRRIAATEY
jgi:tetratricopeptide (TPR) repeat protein